MAMNRRTECFIIELCELCSRWPDSVRDTRISHFGLYVGVLASLLPA